MRLLLAHNYYRSDGGESAVFRAIGAMLRTNGHTVHEYTRDNQEVSSLPPAAKLGLLAAGISSRRTTDEITALIQSVRPEAALVQNVFPLISPAIYRVLKSHGVPVLQLVYNYRFICPDSHLYTAGAICERCVRGSLINAVIFRCYRNSPLYSAWYAGIIGWHRFQRTFTEIDHFLVPDQFMRRKLGEGGLPAERMTVVGNPFDMTGYLPSAIEDDYVLFVGRLIPQKGILTPIRAFARTPGPTRLIVIGDGEIRDEAEQLVRELAPTRVAFLGQVWGEELRHFLERCLFVCIPSEWYDNAPLILYQAFALGKPVIATRTNGLPEVVTEGVDGLLAEMGDVEDWAANIARLIEQEALRHAFGANARRKAEKQFTAAAYYSRLRRVLDEFRG